MFKVSNLGPKIVLGASLYAAFGLISPTANANLIDLTYGVGAGSFELGAFVNTGGLDFMPLSLGATTITGWTVGGPGDGVDWITIPTYGADTGIYSVDLQHLTAGSISTDIPTVAGDVYDLSFGAASNSSYPNSNVGVVSAGSLVNQAFTAAFSSSFSNQTFTPFSFQFTATAPTTTIQFISTGSGHYGPVIDSVSVERISGPTPSVPEPSSLALWGIGALGMAVAAKRRRQQAA